MSGMVTAREIPSFNNGGDSRPQTGSRPPLRDVLHDVTVFLRKYVVMTEAQATAVALWVAHTHLIKAAECTPYLQITSATKRAGKTRLLEVLEPLVASPWFTGRVSAAVLVRKTDDKKPTLLLDESDAAFHGEKEYAEALRGILNTGYRKSGRASLCIGQGANITYRDFSTFSPKAIAGIGELPSTVADRAIPIVLQRRRQDEACARWRERFGHEEARPLREALDGWAGVDVLIQMLENAGPELPSGLGDRQADVWEPLLAIADSAGDDWATRARQAALELSGQPDDTDVVVELLADIDEILDEDALDVFVGYERTLVSTTALLAKLVSREERPWATWRKGDKPLTGRGLALLLRPFGIHPTKNEHDRGYRLDAILEAFARYLPSYVSKRHSPNENGGESPISMCQSSDPAGTCKTAVDPIKTASDGAWTHRNPVTGERTLTDVIQDQGDDEFRKGWQP